MTDQHLPESVLLHYARRMTHDEIRAARLALGLSQSDLAKLLDTDTKTVSRLEMRPESATYRTPAPRTVRLIQAYLAGYRPPDWPDNSTGSRPGPKKRKSTMAKFEVSSNVSGQIAGIYEGESEDDALDAYARDAGYKDYRDACSITDPEDLDAEVEKCRGQMTVKQV